MKIKHTLLALVLLLPGIALMAAGKGDDAQVERRIRKIMEGMTLEQKVGQMTQLTLDVIGRGEHIAHSYMPFEFDEAMLDTVIHRYKVGSILNTASNTPLEVETWSRIVRRLQEEAMADGGIPIIYGVDQIHGVTYTVGGTLFPQQIGMAATWNPQLVAEGAEICAYESMAGNVPWNFSPILDLGRDPRWPRMWETYGEDSYLVSAMGVAAVRGYQGPDRGQVDGRHVAACLKHYLGYGAPYSGRDRTPALIPDNELRERHFQPFVDAVKAGALSVMANSGLINGVPVHASHRLLTEWLKEDLAWDGVIVTDWNDINNLWSRDRLCTTPKEAVKIAINAGIDMSMVPYDVKFCTYLKELVEEGEVPMSRIDDAVSRILRLKFRLNLFERPYAAVSDYPAFASDASAGRARAAAGESITLLKNENGLLPLSPDARILVTGPAVNSMRALNGGWTLSWQGEKADLYGEKYQTILEALAARAGSGRVVYAPGVTYTEGNPPTTSIPYYAENQPQIDEAVQAAAGVDCIVLCLGENSYCETPGNLDDLTLSPNQLALAAAMAATGKPVVLVLAEGRPRIISSIEPQMQAVVQTYLPGNYGGEALAAILYGDVNPSGRLPYTYPRHVNALTTYDHKPCETMDVMEGAYNYEAVVSVQWPFGYGLSYTTFAYANLQVDKAGFRSGDRLTFTVDVTNTGKRAGKEVVMLFSSDLAASISPDVRRLRAFEKVGLQPGETRRVTLTVPADDLAFVGADGRWRLEKGDFDIQVGNQVVRVACAETRVWDTPNR